MRAAVPALSAIAFLLISLGLFLGGRLAVPARHAPDAGPPEAGLAGTGEPPRAHPGTPPDPSLSSSRLIAPAVVAPPPLDPNELQREPPRAPLSALSLPLPPKRDEPEGGRLFRPLAVESAVVEAMGRKVAIAGTRSVTADESCEFEGEPWACGMRARTAFRMWLRGRALDCDLPPDGGYPSSFSATGSPPINTCGYPASHGAFNGVTTAASNANPGNGTVAAIFKPFTANLSAYVGQTVRIRWRISSRPCCSISQRR